MGHRHLWDSYSRIREYLDLYLQPLVVQGQSYLKDSKELNILSNTGINSNTFFVTVDVESLYTNFKQKDGLSVVKWALKTKSKLKSSQIKFLVEGLELAMINNHFWYQGTHYNQVKGVAMGARYALSVANLVLNKWEQEQIHKHEWEGLKLYKSYIDDIVLL